MIFVRAYKWRILWCLSMFLIVMGSLPVSNWEGFAAGSLAVFCLVEIVELMNRYSTYLRLMVLLNETCPGDCSCEAAAKAKPPGACF